MPKRFSEQELELTDKIIRLSASEGLISSVENNEDLYRLYEEIKTACREAAGGTLNRVHEMSIILILRLCMQT